MNILTCGVFDLIHIGHINFLQRIKKDNDKLIVLLHSDRFVSTYKRLPIINEKDRLQMLQNIKCVDDVFIDDNDYLTGYILEEYKIDKVYHASSSNTWSYYFYIPIQRSMMEFIDYDNTTISTTSIINKINGISETDYKNRYTRENILESEKFYGKGYQSPLGNILLDKVLPNNNFKNILEIGSGLGGNCNYLSDKHKCSITGIDICKDMIDICNERNTETNIQYIVSDYKDYETTNKYDLIVCRDVFIYLYTDKKYKYLQKVKSQLSENGVFVLIDYCRGENNSEQFKEYCMNRKWNVVDVPFYKKLIVDSGFTINDSDSLSQDYIDYGEHKKNDIMISDDVKSNLELKLGYLKDKSFEWHYFILG
jgi:phosphoethanolamine N-methyltransferase